MLDHSFSFFSKDNSHFKKKTSCVAREFTNLHVTDKKDNQTQDNNWEFEPTTLGAIESGVVTA